MRVITLIILQNQLRLSKKILHSTPIIIKIKFLILFNNKAMAIVILAALVTQNQ